MIKLLSSQALNLWIPDKTFVLLLAFFIFFHFFNTRIYNLIYVSRIARLLLGDALISSKTDPHNGSKKEKRSYGKTKNNKTMLKILPFIRILYLKQQSSILRCFSRLKSEKVYLAMQYVFQFYILE